MSESSFQDIENWLDQLSGASEAPTPPLTLPRPLSTISGYRQKRRVSMASARDSSPSKRPRIADDRTITSEISLRSTTTTSRQSRIRAFDPFSADEIPKTAFSDSSTLSDVDLDELWSELKTICFDARQCDIYGKDENAWCLDVVQPILISSIKGCQLLQLISSQQIGPSILPRSKNALSKINKKADYTLSFTCRDTSVRYFYDRISLGGHGYQLSQTTDAFTKRVLLFSGMEVKSDEGSKKEALAELAI
ncbi:hypothetical protein BO94DRAFT_183977 [Aspergillus sclerotioniger CBS 115572]|uniref:PD-(D/E)XK nuclease-like domain-containing protein n=1 Tax=Aspergillus sclerotioniger CBS 115572 TaxID=1450535 RepID=A0A317VXE5_9EURO|nr:hypothetical protein BO94DRAFT_183977 [Aspergillus sclerotioniger CBS 115572]PWY78011.1 hypothetical protein BO94DRAFT_183977 [Aspergillus sclerotioniger CBS 115572]